MKQQIKEAVKKTAKFYHCPKMAEGRVSTAAKLFIEEKYGHVFRDGAGVLHPN